jgi:hypothetical protein
VFHRLEPALLAQVLEPSRSGGDVSDLFPVDHAKRIRRVPVVDLLESRDHASPCLSHPALLPRLGQLGPRRTPTSNRDASLRLGHQTAGRNTQTVDSKECR